MCRLHLVAGRQAVGRWRYGNLPGSATGLPDSLGPIIGAKLLYVFKPATFDPSTQASANLAWDQQPPLANKRYYPTVALGHERWVFIARGHTNDSDPNNIRVEDDFEMWNRFLNNNNGAPENVTRDGPNTQNENGLAVSLTYPRMVLLSNGQMFHHGMDTESASKRLPTDPWTYKGVSEHTYRFYGTAVRFPNIDAKHTDAQMILGGLAADGTVLDTVQICKPTAANPGGFDDAVQGYDWTPTHPTPAGAQQPFPPMNDPRYTLNAVLLPDATIVVIGGTRTGEGVTPIDFVYEAERFRAGQWEALAPMAVNRRYHTTTLLLPSGQVLIAGGEGRSFDYELFNPPYMYKPRPMWLQSQEQVSYGGIYAIDFTLPPGAALGKVVLMRPGCNTHHFDADQRYYQLPLLPPLEGHPPSPRYYQLPNNADALAPGYWMIFLVTADGIPSEARWVKVQ